MLSVAVVVSKEINSRYYFQSDLCICMTQSNKMQALSLVEAGFFFWKVSIPFFFFPSVTADQCGFQMHSIENISISKRGYIPDLTAGTEHAKPNQNCLIGTDELKPSLQRKF